MNISIRRPTFGTSRWIEVLLSAIFDAEVHDIPEMMIKPSKAKSA